MHLRPGRRRALSARARAGLVRVLERTSFELLPLRGAADRASALPPGSTVSVTASPAKGLEVTVDLAASLHAAGYRAVPHLSARQVRDRTHLRSLLGRMADSGLDTAFVVGGDAETPGAYSDGLALLRAVAELGAPLRSVGIPCYPDGHASIPDTVLLDALRAKAPFATWMTTQLCFNPTAIERWVRARRQEGLALPVVLGIPGVTEPHRLLAISARIGVRDSGRFLAGNAGLVARLVRSGGFYRPDGLLTALAPLIGDPAAGIHGLHLYTFNQVAATQAWRERFAARLRPQAASPGSRQPEHWTPAGRNAGWLTPGDP